MPDEQTSPEVSRPASPPMPLTAGRETSRLRGLAEREDYFAALGTVRFARNLFVILVVVSLLLQVTLYLLVRFWDITALEQLLRDTAVDPAADATTLTAWNFLLGFGVPLAHFVGACSAFLLAVACLLGVNVCLAGRLGGAHGSISAFFWSVLLLAMLVPWQQIVPVIEVPSVFYTVSELQRVVDFQPGRWIDQVQHYVRFLGYPALALLVILAVGLGARRGYRQVRQQIASA